MEKRRRTYDLESIKEAFSSVDCLGGRITATAFRDAQQLGLSREDIIKVIQALRQGDFYKSMTTYANHHLWQDVYHTKYGDLLIYLKLSIKQNGDYLLVSFKEK